MQQITTEITLQDKERNFDPLTESIKTTLKVEKLRFFYPETPQEVPLWRYGQFLELTSPQTEEQEAEAIPMFARVIMGLQEISEIPLEHQEERFRLGGCSDEDKEELFVSICRVLGCFVEAENLSSSEGLKEPLSYSLFADIEPSSGVFINALMFLLVDIWAPVAQAITDISVWKSGKLEGRNTFVADNRKFYLPAERVAKLASDIGQNYAKYLSETDFVVNYNVWNATSAFFFQNPKNAAMLSNNAKAGAGLMAAMAVEMKEFDPPVYLEMPEMTTDQLTNRTMGLMELFYQSLTLEQFYLASFFFRHTIHSLLLNSLGHSPNQPSLRITERGAVRQKPKSK